MRRWSYNSKKSPPLFRLTGSIEDSPTINPSCLAPSGPGSSGPGPKTPEAALERIGPLRGRHRGKAAATTSGIVVALASHDSRGKCQRGAEKIPTTVPSAISFMFAGRGPPANNNANPNYILNQPNNTQLKRPTCYCTR